MMPFTLQVASFKVSTQQSRNKLTIPSASIPPPDDEAATTNTMSTAMPEAA
jgi:hypothetical protein